MFDLCLCNPSQERFYFGDTVLPLFESGIPLLRERLKRLPDADNIIIAYPDEGAWKRFKYQFGDYQEVGTLHSTCCQLCSFELPIMEGCGTLCQLCWSVPVRALDCMLGVQVICTKVRDGAKRIVRLKEGEPRGKHVVIVDDLVQSGGTLIECQKLLAAQVGRWNAVRGYLSFKPHNLRQPRKHRWKVMDGRLMPTVTWTAAGRRQRQRVRDTRRVPQRHIRALQPARQWQFYGRLQVFLDHGFVRQLSACTSRSAAIRGGTLQLTPASSSVPLVPQHALVMTLPPHNSPHCVRRY